MIYINYYSTPGVNLTINAGSGGLLLTGMSPLLGSGVAVSKGDLTLTGKNPTLHNSGDSCGLLLRFEGATLDVDENDTRTNTFHTAGSPTLSTTSPKWGSGNMDIDAASTDENLAATGSNFRASTSASFTLEFWFYPTSEGSSRTGAPNVLRHAICTICSAYPVTASNYSDFPYFWWHEGSSGTLGAANSGSSVTGVTINTWHHAAVVYNSSTTFLDYYVDGARFAHLSGSYTTNFNTLYFGNMKYGGGLSDGLSANYLTKARFDSIRFKDGVALYSGTTYTVPTADFNPP